MSNLLKNIDDAKLTAMPDVANKIMSLNMDIDRDQDSLVPAICQCPVTSTRIIAIANSAAYGIHGIPITSVKEAVQRIGINIAYSAALACSLNTFGSKSSGGLNFHMLWLHVIETKRVMLELARLVPSKLRPSDANISLLALVHDIGYLAYNALAPEESKEFFVKIKKFNAVNSDELSTQIFGITHAELGAKLLEKWMIPDFIVQAVRQHHNKFSELKSGDFLLRDILVIAEILLSYSPNTYDAHFQIITAEELGEFIGVRGDGICDLVKSLKLSGVPVVV